MHAPAHDMFERALPDANSLCLYSSRIEYSIIKREIISAAESSAYLHKCRRKRERIYELVEVVCGEYKIRVPMF